MIIYQREEAGKGPEGYKESLLLRQTRSEEHLQKKNGITSPKANLIRL